MAGFLVWLEVSAKPNTKGLCDEGIARTLGLDAEPAKRNDWREWLWRVRF
jgi:hypothetical protein